MSWELTPASLLERAWGVIANAGEGSWERESPQWQEAAAGFREGYFAWLDESGEPHGDSEDET